MKKVFPFYRAGVYGILLLWGAAATPGLRAAAPEEYTLTNITGWSAAQLATLSHFDRYAPVAPAGASGDFVAVSDSGVGLVAGNRGSLGAYVESAAQTNIPAWGTYYWSYWIWDGHDYHYYSGNVTHSPVRAVNVLGQIVGYATLPGSGSSSGDYDNHGYFRDTNTGSHVDITPTAHRADPRDLNDLGEVTGTWSDASTFHPFRRSADGAFTDFIYDEPFSHSIAPAVINNHGHVVGMITIWMTPRIYHPFFSEAGSALIELPYPSQASPDTGSIADINDHDVIVGEAHKAASPLETSAVRWSRDGATWSAADLNELLADNFDFILDRCIAVNDAGHIIASGHLDGGPDNTYNTHKLLLTPDVFAPPAVTTLPAANVTSHSATLRAKINAANLSTAWQFEFGATAAYGSATSSGAAAGTAPVLGEASLTGLQPRTTYHARATGSNSEGVTDGMDVAFTTAWDWPSWAAATLGAADPSGDANTNGIPDLVDYGTGNAPAPEIAVDASQVLITFRHSLIADGVTLVVQVSKDLLHWEDGSSYGYSASTSSNAFSTEVSRVPDGTGGEIITVSVDAFEARRYVRLAALSS